MLLLVLFELVAIGRVLHPRHDAELALQRVIRQQRVIHLHTRMRTQHTAYMSELLIVAACLQHGTGLVN